MGASAVHTCISASLRELLQQEYAVGRRTALGRAWRCSQNQIVYALGNLGAFEVLRECEVSEIRYRSWKVLLAMGAIREVAGCWARWITAARPPSI